MLDSSTLLHSRSNATADRFSQAAALALTALAAAVGGGLVLGPSPVTTLLAGGAALACVAALWISRPRPARAEPERALAVSTLGGTLLAASEAFAEAMAARGLEAHPDALAVDDKAALALFAARHEALVTGSADFVLPPATLLSITRREATLAYALELAAPAAAADPAAASALELTAAKTLVATVPAPLAVAAADGTVLAANPGFEALSGAARNLAAGFSIARPDLVTLVRRAKSGREARLDVDRPGSERKLSLTASAFPGGDAVVIAATDVTEQSALQAHMLQSQKMQAVGELAGNIAHDFNNVLAAIMGFSDLLLQNHRPSDPAFNDIMNIKQSAQRAARLVKQLLAFSRRQTLRPTVINLNDAIADLATMLDRLLGEPVRLDIAYGRDLWPVLADLAQVEQVVINLAVNARDAMPAGGSLTIRTRNVPSGEVLGEDEPLDTDAVLVEVEDVGTGMPQDVLAKIFEPFFTTKATGEGTGLGLSTVYGVVKQTGGTLAVDSAPGRGTTFRVYLPRADAEPKLEVEPRAADPKPSATPAAPVADLTGSATLLLVEDEEAVRAFAARALSAKGYRVLSAGSGLEAAELYAAEAGAVDLLLTDVIMPELDGPSLVRQLRAARPDLKVVFMSGYADGAALDDLGPVEFLEKPFTLKALAEAVKRELGRTQRLPQS